MDRPVPPHPAAPHRTPAPGGPRTAGRRRPRRGLSAGLPTGRRAGMPAVLPTERRAGMPAVLPGERRAGVLAVAALLGGLAVPGAAAAAGPPAAPALLAPADGTTGVTAGSQLRVAVSDPDGGPLDVRFHGRRTDGAGGTNPAGDFTFAVLPDTQNYASAAANRPIMGAQTQWLVDNRAALNLKFVSHVGDIVGIPTVAAQWQSASGYLSTLDSAGVPNSVLPGNHDMDVATGAAPEYRQWFPPSRYANASWNSPAVSYGGYLGQDLFGPDPVDRGNMDSFALMSAGGMDFLILSLEFDPPDQVIDWAGKVLAAYPQRRAILVTHSYVNTAGQLASNLQRPGGNTGAQLWQKLVAPNCSIFMVVSGHFHDGDLSEARRTDTNSCGRPVQGLLSDYQERVNGGDGWLRYYTFRPSADEIRAVTYSPTLGRAETDADSAFTLPYDMTLPTGFTEIGRTTTASGGTAAVPVPDLPAGTGYEWYATVGDGTTTTTGPTWSFTTATRPAPAVLAADGFGRTVAAGSWGSAEVGGGWQLSGGASRASVSGGAGVQGVPSGVTAVATLPGVGSTATDLTAKVALDSVPNGPIYLTAAARRTAAGDYGGRLKVNANGSVELHTTRPAGIMAGGVLPGLTVAAGQQLQVRVQAEGTGPTTVRARAWRAGTAEPSTWTLSSTDATAGMQVPGTVGLTSYLSSSTTNGPVTVRYDDVRATPTGTAAPANTPPAAAFTSSATGLAVSVDGSTSTDTDGTITSYGWSFGDGGTGSGRTTTHTYGGPGTYPVTLTVTDDDGATATRTAQVTVTAPAAVLAADGFGRSVTGGWGTAGTGGPWTVSGGATRFTVAGGTGLQAVPAGITTAATLSSISATATDTVVRIAADRAVDGAVYAWVHGRKVGGADYAARVKILPSGAVELHLTRSGTALAGGALPGVTLAAGQQLTVRVQATGTSPTTLRARAWRTGTAEPSAWAVTSTDATAGLQSAGSVAVSTYLSSSTTNGPVTTSWDDLTVTRP
jgi:PKD repeat protein